MSRSPLSLEDLELEDYIREFKQLKLKVSLDKELKLKIARFTKGLSPGIANKADLQPNLSFNDVCNVDLLY